MLINNLIREENFYHHFQPIYDLNNWRILGFEVLLRSKLFPNPEATFIEARKEKKLYELDSGSIHKAISTYRSAGLTKSKGKLFLNIFPSTLLHPNFPTFLNKIIAEDVLLSQQIVLELSESEINNKMDELKQKIAVLKNFGFLIAIDDTGKGYSNAQSIVELDPDFLKLDRYFSKDLHLSKKKQSYIQLLNNYSVQNDCSVILEGIETPSELAVAKTLDIQYGQGFILGKPSLLEQII
ncbi:EAL domain-containing protein [Alkalihalobacterium alkalinitrilicum]|uniref:EAL domain-containing protein n=1 Tax=Alkalihalobacterium alkalinitrilicum TaxID=427920 RepID=UPI0009956B6D|nr:EAL domain-containing protein [Alkalihalobacterium alkalinitrilicum]